ncbi:flagellar biosynthesis protein FlhB [Rhizobium rhizogenes]|uniref:flagellar biosynthesis protein FlhB n=1 Tax=Rhizobium rhizogenes TaxID=359 RepID=UPI00064907AC|nr:flagellar biosynthesis protein FlhB [Rhizobium rhizogenes]
MADEDKDSKTEKPTEKKLRDTMDKGNVPHSREATIFASMLATVIYVTFFLPERVGRMGEVLRDLFEKPDQWQLETGTDALSLFTRIGWEVGNLLLPAIVLFFIFGIGSSMFQNLPTPVLDRIQPKFSRISPVSGWNRLFSTSGLVEFGKSLAKIVVVGIIMYFVLRGQFFHAIDSLASDPQTIFVRLSTIVQRILTIVLLATAVVGIADVAWSRHHWFDQLKMTKQEIKDEYKQSQGDPIVKSRQRSVARDRARRRMIKQVPRATLIIANPTHFAVALRYVREEGDAPVVVAKGQDLIALKIREIAEANGIPIFEDPPLARSMFAQVSVDSVIPSVFYKAVAELIHRIYAQSNRTRVR